MIKDYLKFRNAIKKDNNLSLEECYMLETLFDYYNVAAGYAYPSYETLMSDLKTKRRAKISKLLKSLVKKGYIEINKSGKKNTYRLLKYLFISAGKSKTEEEEIPEDVSQEEQTIIDETGFTHKQAKNILKIAKDKIDKVLNAFKYAIDHKANNVYSYVQYLIKENIDVDKKEKTYSSSSSNKTIAFLESCDGRNYSGEWYDDVEKRLLGWA